VDDAVDQAEKLVQDLELMFYSTVLWRTLFAALCVGRRNIFADQQ
jgi:hypothetical protein